MNILTWNSLTEEEKVIVSHKGIIKGRCQKCYSKTNKIYCNDCLKKARQMLNPKGVRI